MGARKVCDYNLGCGDANMPIDLLLITGLHAGFHLPSVWPTEFGSFRFASAEGSHEMIGIRPFIKLLRQLIQREPPFFKYFGEFIEPFRVIYD